MARAVHIRLTRPQKASLERLRRESRDPRVVRRATIVLMSADAYPVADICAATGVCPATVHNTRRRWLREKRKGLEDKPREGRPPVADGEYLAYLLGAVNAPPSRYGYAFGVWTTGRLAAHMARVSGKRISASRVGKLLRGCGYVWGRPKHTLKGKRDETAYRRGRAQLRLLKKGLDAATPPTSSSSSTRPTSTSTRTWLGAGDVEDRK